MEPTYRILFRIYCGKLLSTLEVEFRAALDHQDNFASNLDELVRKHTAMTGLKCEGGSASYEDSDLILIEYVAYSIDMNYRSWIKFLTALVTSVYRTTIRRHLCGFYAITGTDVARGKFYTEHWSLTGNRQNCIQHRLFCKINQIYSAESEWNKCRAIRGQTDFVPEVIPDYMDIDLLIGKDEFRRLVKGAIDVNLSSLSIQ